VQPRVELRGSEEETTAGATRVREDEKQFKGQEFEALGGWQIMMPDSGAGEDGKEQTTLRHLHGSEVGLKCKNNTIRFPILSGVLKLSRRRQNGILREPTSPLRLLRMSNWFLASLNSRRWCSFGTVRIRSICSTVVGIVTRLFHRQIIEQQTFRSVADTVADRVSAVTSARKPRRESGE
jgi:hypothetical protein